MALINNLYKKKTMKYLKSIEESFGMIDKKKFKTRDDVKLYLKKEIERQGEHVVIRDLDLTGVKNLAF